MEKTLVREEEEEEEKEQGEGEYEKRRRFEEKMRCFNFNLQQRDKKTGCIKILALGFIKHVLINSHDHETSFQLTQGTSTLLFFFFFFFFHYVTYR